LFDTVQGKGEKALTTRREKKGKKKRRVFSKRMDDKGGMGKLTWEEITGLLRGGPGQSQFREKKTGECFVFYMLLKEKGYQGHGRDGV